MKRIVLCVISIAWGMIAHAAEYGGEIGAEIAGQKLNNSSRFNPDNVGKLNTFGYRMTGDLWFRNSFNPDANGFMKIRALYMPAAFRKEDETGKMIVREIYIDLLGERWNARIGKQYLKWGSGVFFNPADVINAVRDPLRPADEAEGNPIAHLSIPIGSVAACDLLGVVREGEADHPSDVPGVFRMSASAGNFGLFGYVMARKNRKPAYGYNLDFVSALTEDTDISLYAEGIIRRESDVKYVTRSGSVVGRKDGTYPGTTAGLRLNMKFPTLKRFDVWTLTIEYYHDNENWSRDEYRNMYRALESDLSAGNIYPQFKGGRDYVYGNISVSNVVFNLVTVEGGAVINLGDRSGIALGSVSYQYNDNTETGVRGEFYFGRDGSEFGNAIAGRVITGFVKTSF